MDYFLGIPVIYALLVIGLIRTLQNMKPIKQQQLPAWVSSKNVSIVIVNVTCFILSAIFLFAYAALIYPELPDLAAITIGYVALGIIVFLISTIFPAIALAEFAGRYPQYIAVGMRRRVQKALSLQLTETILFVCGVGLAKIIFSNLTAINLLFAIGLVLLN